MLTLRFVPRPVPLVAVAAVARGEASFRLAHRLLEHELGALTAVAGEELLVVCGDSLPWVDGIVYLGRPPEAPGLLLPTTLRPTCPEGLLETALVRRARSKPVAVLTDPPLLVPMSAARQLDRGALERWLTER